MNINPSSSAVSLFNSAQQKANTAGKEIAQLPVQKNEVGSADFNAKDIIKPVISLKSAEFETSAAAKLVEADNKAIGSLIDLRA